MNGTLTRKLCAVAAGAIISLALTGADAAAVPGTALRPQGLPAGAVPVTAYVVDEQWQGKVTPIDTATNTKLRTITAGAKPTAIAITPDGKKAYVANSRGDHVTPINTVTNRADKPIEVGAGPGYIAITPDGKTAYVVNKTSGTVTPIRTATGTALRAIAVAAPRRRAYPDAIAITPDGKTAYVAFDGGVTPISTATNKAGKPIKAGSGPIAINPNSKTADVLNSVYGAPGPVPPIDTATNTALTAITVGINPDAIAI